MTVQFTRPGRHESDERSEPPRRKRIEIQDTFLFGSLKDGRVLVFSLVTGKELTGKIKRFDRYALIVDDGTLDILVYKHAIVNMVEVAGSADPHNRA